MLCTLKHCKTEFNWLYLLFRLSVIYTTISVVCLISIQTERIYHFQFYIDKLRSVCDDNYHHRIYISVSLVIDSFSMLNIKIMVADIQTTHSLTN